MQENGRERSAELQRPDLAELSVIRIRTSCRDNNGQVSLPVSIPIA